jgi:hypothetical protein
MSDAECFAAPPALSIPAVDAVTKQIDDLQAAIAEAARLLPMVF